ncbi:uncharacterized protein FN964_007835 isoform 3-T9 [Alca torda]
MTDLPDLLTSCPGSGRVQEPPLRMRWDSMAQEQGGGRERPSCGAWMQCSSFSRFLKPAEIFLKGIPIPQTVSLTRESSGLHGTRCPPSTPNSGIKEVS